MATPTGHKGLIDLPVDALVQAAPNLHCLCLGSTEYDASRLSFPTAPLINLRRLFFDVSCNLHSTLLTEIVSNAPKLEFLALHWAGFTRMYEMRFHSGEAVVRCTTGVWDVIQTCRDSLRELRVHISDYIKSKVPEERDSPRDFRRLEVLKLNDHALSALYDAWKKKNRYTGEPDSFLSSILPPMIREVTFWDLKGLAMRAAMQSFARVAAFGPFRYLEKVTVAPSEAKYGPNSPWYNWRTWADVEAELEENFTKAGASFELVKSDQVIIWGWDFRLDPVLYLARSGLSLSGCL
ncbi:uncharacterized protein B0T15DRAFT_522714 [Chaetomium strumarium]|uniref:Uncharacterized protein n=1 Tax=Chaetomium strumarium TaxID=1170767 RepID=A0AAJ0GXB6_9PEZI|nr:hypothetical protein B0T15DRAFT_522714 [Chaetomium strumarium]